MDGCDVSRRQIGRRPCKNRLLSTCPSHSVPALCNATVKFLSVFPAEGYPLVTLATGPGISPEHCSRFTVEHLGNNYIAETEDLPVDPGRLPDGCNAQTTARMFARTVSRDVRVIRHCRSGRTTLTEQRHVLLSTFNAGGRACPGHPSRYAWQPGRRDRIGRGPRPPEPRVLQEFCG